MHEIIAINERTWRIEDQGVRFFLLEGNDSAMLIDSGMNTGNARKIAEGITNKPVKLMNTHADPDHIAGNEAFESFYMHEKEWSNYHDAHSKNGTLIPVKDGDEIDLGGRTLKIYELPGHTPGSIAILDVEARALIGGDAIQDGRIFMFGERRNLSLYIQSLEAFWNRHRSEFDVVYPSHGTFPVKPALISELVNAAMEIQAGQMSGRPVSFMGKEIVYYDAGCTGFLCDR